LQSIYKDYKDKGFEIIAINVGDKPELIDKYVRENGWSFPIVMGTEPVAAAYKVGPTPSNFLVDSNGKIVWQSIGLFEEKELRDALKQAGLE
jgi:thioredoxin-related protein